MKISWILFLASSVSENDSIKSYLLFSTVLFAFSLNTTLLEKVQFAFSIVLLALCMLFLVVNLVTNKNL